MTDAQVTSAQATGHGMEKPKRPSLRGSTAWPVKLHEKMTSHGSSG